MWTRKTIKRPARQALRANYWRTVIVCLLMLTIAGAYGYSTQLDLNVETGIRTGNVDYFAQFEDLFARISGEGEYFASRGALSMLVRQSFSAGSVSMGIFNAATQLAFGQNISAAVLLLIGVVFYILYNTFVSNPLTVGEARFFLESRRYTESRANRLLFVYSIRRTRHVAMVMFWQTVAIVLSMLTVVGGVIVVYQLRLVPWILAENPSATRKEAFRLSRGMMRGNKWRCFLLDMSYAGWYLLSFVSFGLLGILYVNPYRTGADAELYTLLRAGYLQANPEAAAVLHDEALFIPHPEAGVYPAGRFDIPESEQRRWLNLDYHRRYSWQHVVLLFFSFMLIGWLWEVAVEVFGKGVFVNRGTLLGPWLPLYGCGGVGVVLALRKWIDRPVLTFFLAVGFSGVLEYFTAFMLETLMGVRWWDYTGYFLNIHGRVCAEGLIVFGLAGCLGIYLMAPVLDNMFLRIPKRVKTVLCVVLLLLFAADVVYSALHPNTGEHITYSLNPDENTYGLMLL